MNHEHFGCKPLYQMETKIIEALNRNNLNLLDICWQSCRFPHQRCIVGIHLSAFLFTINCIKSVREKYHFLKENHCLFSPSPRNQCAWPSILVPWYHNLDSSMYKVLATAFKVTDTRCPDESRLLQCQLTNGVVDSNVNIATRQQNFITN